MTEHVTRTAGAVPDAPVPAPAPRRLLDLSRADSLALLGSVRLGRIVFTRNALPAIRPVNHILDEGQIVIRTHGDSALALQTGGSGIGGVVVAYEADQIDPDTHQGWSVVVTGYARVITDPEKLARYQALLTAWVDTVMDAAVVIRPDMVTGFRLD
ncbi:MAG TPA: pyridoxamine 5'-phosphate oxidase family protein [Thermoleophilia bacterium]|jgi:nitroimidazol reductase NimA-like FMN-containing flavoprotein (pyridoxamine 5'-phosphate oxidase superfamily)|nr:pyridoxamine 5'-phosphate oxidase family protein [Thermoleophilia bacterium]